ncbi:hypothetical protein [Nocardia sp. CNY236]|uniref:hypothetical protein n=1 Tax=Nocardia sp. CNY236 TaxID=1169152 RepID=UPI00040C4E41|nr:hypothetical protein [Nocardia sp. CNY236]
MHFVSEQVLGMAQAIEPAADATRGYAAQIEQIGFESAHAGQDYRQQGQQLAAGVDSVVKMLHSWSEASGATAETLRRSVATNESVDQDNRARIDAAARDLGAG